MQIDTSTRRRFAAAVTGIAALATISLSACSSGSNDLDDGVDVTVPNVDIMGPGVTDVGVGADTAPGVTMPEVNDAGG